MLILNISANVTKNGQHYPGFTIWPGVEVTFTQDEGEPERLVFSNADRDSLPSVIYRQAVNGGDFSDTPDPHYLQIHAPL
jgi:hypothetical protein